VRSDVAVRSYGRIDDLTEARPDVVIVDATAEAVSAVQCLTDVCGAAPEAFVIAIVSDSLRPAEWRLRELGAKVVVGENIGGYALAQLCGTALRAFPGAKERR
jgi:DNA-binding NarL/FixJ family response regulator